MLRDNYALSSLVRRVESLEDRVTPAAAAGFPVANLVVDIQTSGINASNDPPVYSIVATTADKIYPRIDCVDVRQRRRGHHVSDHATDRGHDISPLRRASESSRPRRSAAPAPNSRPRFCSTGSSTSASRPRSYSLDTTALNASKVELTDSLGTPLSGFNAGETAIVGTKLYFTAIASGVTGLYSIDSSAPVKVDTGSLSDPSQLTTAGGLLFFSASDTQANTVGGYYAFNLTFLTGRRVTTSDGTFRPNFVQGAVVGNRLFVSGTSTGDANNNYNPRMAYIDVNPSTGASLATFVPGAKRVLSEATVVGDRVFFQTADPNFDFTGISNLELSFVDATSPTQVNVLDLDTVPGGSGNGILLGVSGDRAFVQGQNGVYTFDLADSFLSYDLVGGIASIGSRGKLFPVVNGRIYYFTNESYGISAGANYFAPEESKPAHADIPSISWISAPVVRGSLIYSLGSTINGSTSTLSLYSFDPQQQGVSVRPTDPFANTPAPIVEVSAFNLTPGATTFLIDVDLNNDGVFNGAGEAGYVSGTFANSPDRRGDLK